MGDLGFKRKRSSDKIGPHSVWFASSERQRYGPCTIGYRRGGPKASCPPCRRVYPVASCAATFSLCGCILGPTALQVSRTRYDEVIHKTTSGQLLLNLVRLRYREDPPFIEVGNVSSQFVFDKSAGAVRCRGYWFYIDNTDLHSKSMFALLRQLFFLQAGQLKGAAPVLTLPVGG